MLRPPADFVSQIKSEHPRLMVNDSDLARIQQQVETSELAADLKQKLITESNRLLDVPVSKYEFTNGRTLLLVTREVQRRSAYLSLAYRVTKDERYAARAYKELYAVAQFPDWNPTSWLSVAELLYGYAIGYDWLYDYLSTEQRAILRDAIVKFGLNEAKIAYDTKASWTETTNNWNIVCNGGIIMAALAIGDEVPELANELLQRAYDSLPVALAEYGPDGGYPEGTMYWGYANRFLFSTIASLDTAIGDDFGISDAPGISQTADFGIYLTGPLGQTFNYADSTPSNQTGAPETYWMAQRYRQPGYAWWADQGARRTGAGSYPPLHLMWIGMIESAHPGAQLPLDKAFERAKVETMRSGWDRSATFVGFRMGNNAANHGDLDMGTFALDALGQRWAAELGGDSYSLPGYFDSEPGGQRWQYYRKRAEGQNTLVLNPGADPGQSQAATGQLVRRAGNAAAAFSIADLSSAVSGDSQTSWQRGITAIDGRSRVVVQDEVSAAKPVDPWWFMHTAADVRVADDGQTATLSLGGKQLLARLLDAPPGAKFSVMAAKALPTSPNPDGQDPNAGIRKLVVTAEPSAKFRLAVLLEPLVTDQPAPPPAVRDLADWELPNLAEPRLAQLAVDGEPLTGFSPDSLTYTVERPAGTTPPQISATSADGAPVKVQQATSIPGQAEVCLAADGDECAVRYVVRIQDQFAGPVSASSASGANPPTNALDHNLATAWTANGEPWIQANLAAPTTVSAISLAWGEGAARQYNFSVETSVDGMTWTEAVARRSSSGTTAELEAYPIEPIQARYVRVRGFGNNQDSSNSIAELRLTTSEGQWPSPPEPTRELIGLEFNQDSFELKPTGRQVIKVQAVYSDGTRRNMRPNQVRFASTNDAVVNVSHDGRIVAQSSGTATITGSFRDQGKLVLSGADVRVTST